MRDSALLTRSSKDRVKRRDCHSVTGPSLCSEVWPISSQESRYVSFRSSFFFPFSVRGQGLGTRRLYVTSCTARKSTERETCRIFPDYHALKSVHLQNLTPSRNLVSHVHKGMVAIIFLGDCRKPNSSHEPSVDFYFFFFSFLNRLLVNEWRRLSHLFTRHIIHCAYVTYRSSMLDVCRVNQVPPTILH